MAAARGIPRAAALAAILAAAGCATPPAAPPAGSPLAPLPALAKPLPDARDRAAHDVAAHALAWDARGARAALERLSALEDAGGRAAPTGLVPAAELLAAGDGPDAWIHAAHRVLDRGDVEPPMRARLEEMLADDPRELARARLSDARRARVARMFNAVSEPLGRSLMGLALAPYRVTRSMLRLAVEERRREAIAVPERQALVHWRRWLEAHPADPEAPRVAQRVEEMQSRWYRMKRDRAVRAARRAEEAGDPRLAFVLSERALRYAPEDAEADEIRGRAGAALERERRRLRRSLATAAEPPVDAGDAAARALALALWRPGGDPLPAAEALRDDPRPAVRDAARLAHATALLEGGRESAAWRVLGEMAGHEPARAPGARHARALAWRAERNPAAAWRETRRTLRRQRALWVLQGDLTRGRPGRVLPPPFSWLVDGIASIEALVGIPNRLVRLPWSPITDAPAAVHARRYLARWPHGEHARELRDWLVDFEEGRGNAFGAWRVASQDPDRAPSELADLRRAAAKQALRAARRERRADVQLALLRQVGAEFPDTPSGRRAAALVRQASEELTAQRIRISRGFLEENPEVAGPEGLALRSELMDGDPSNGELHDEGVWLLGGRVVEITLVERAGNGSAPPQRVRKRISAERLARLVARLDESAQRNALVDPYAELGPDADRDLFFERARLGVADRVDPRATARSTYAFVGARERYGMVRQRESVLPVEIVIQGSLPDLGLGAFPRLPMPRPTPDAVLYR